VTLSFTVDGRPHGATSLPPTTEVAATDRRRSIAKRKLEEPGRSRPDMSLGTDGRWNTVTSSAAAGRARYPRYASDRKTVPLFGSRLRAAKEIAASLHHTSCELVKSIPTIFTAQERWSKAASRVRGDAGLVGESAPRARVPDPRQAGTHADDDVGHRRVAATGAEEPPPTPRRHVSSTAARPIFAKRSAPSAACPMRDGRASAILGYPSSASRRIRYGRSPTKRSG
jgi:hypothetical protein